MTKEQKQFLHAVRKSLSDGDLPTKKTVLRMLECTADLGRKIEVLENLLIVERRTISRMKAQLDEIQSRVLTKVNEAFE